MKTGRARTRELNKGRPANFFDARPVPFNLGIGISEPTPSKLRCIIGTWNDYDIIEANIANCLRQGADRVYVLDNDSSDDTAKRAEAMGAIVHSYTTEKYDDDLRCRMQNDLMKAETKADDSIWWLVLDADEFVSGLRDLQKLPSEVRVAGVECIDLYPQSPTEYVIGQHPASCMSMGTRRHAGLSKYCTKRHWKHPLIRLNGKLDIAHARGAHAIAIEHRSKTIPYEADYFSTPIMFHAPLRREADARRRLELLCGTGRDSWDNEVTKDQGSIKRFRSLDAVYNQRWREVQLPHTQVYGRDVTGLALYPWKTLLGEKNFSDPLT